MWHRCNHSHLSCLHPPSVVLPLRHSRAGGNPGAPTTCGRSFPSRHTAGEHITFALRGTAWVPACAGTTSGWGAAGVGCGTVATIHISVAFIHRPLHFHSVIPAQAGIQEHPQRAVGHFHHGTPQVNTLRLHCVARSGFPPARERRAGGVLPVWDVAPLQPFASQLPSSTVRYTSAPSFPRRRESRSIHNVRSVISITAHRR